MVIVQPRIFRDERGYFLETFQQETFAENGIGENFFQDNHSVSRKNVLRGMHYQCAPYAQGKLVRVAAGRVYDVVVDIRSGSATYGEWFGIELSAENQTMLWVPAGFAHGFLALETDSVFLYKVTAPYRPGHEAGFRFDDPALGIDWPVDSGEAIVSGKDLDLPAFADMRPIA